MLRRSNYSPIPLYPPNSAITRLCNAKRPSVSNKAACVTSAIIKQPGRPTKEAPRNYLIIGPGRRRGEASRGSLIYARRFNRFPPCECGLNLLQARHAVKREIGA